MSVKPSAPPVHLTVWEPPQEEQEAVFNIKDHYKSAMVDPGEYCCPLSGALYVDPVIDGTGRTFEREFLLRHFADLTAKGFPLMSPMSDKKLENENVLPNADKVRDVANYKLRKAVECYKSAESLVKSRCGETALMLIDRIRQLNPGQEGLSQLEAVARETFVSRERQQSVYCQRAELLLQEGNSTGAVELLKQFETEPEYHFSRGKETIFNGFELEASHISTNGKLACIRANPSTFHIIDLETQKLVHQMHNKNTLHFYSEKEYKWFFWGNDRVVFFPKREKNKDNTVTNASLHVFIGKLGERCIKHYAYSDLFSTEYRSDKMKDLHVVNNQLYIVGDKVIIVGDFKYLKPGTISGYSVSYLSAVTIDKNDKKSYLFSQDQEMKIEKFKPNEWVKNPPEPLWNGRWTNNKAENFSFIRVCCNKVFFADSFRKITPLYSEKDKGSIPFYLTYMKAAALAGDLRSYLVACEHLIGHHHENKTWDQLEIAVLNLHAGSASLREQLEKEIITVKGSDDSFLQSRLYLSLGLLVQPWMLKQDVYKQAKHPTGDYFPAVETALAYVKTCKRQFQLRFERLEEQAREIKELKAEVERLKETIQSISGKSDN